MASSNEAAGERKMVIYSAAYATNEAVNGPTYCRLVVTQALLDRLNSSASALSDHAFSQCRFYFEPERWGAGHCDIEDELSLLSSEAVLAVGGLFWIEAGVEHGRGCVSTMPIEIEAIASAFASGLGVFHVEIDSDLAHEIRQDEARERGEPVDDDE